MSGPDLQVSRAWPRSENELAVALTVPGLAVDASDLPDLLNPASWVTGGANAPLVVAARALDDVFQGSAFLALTLDAPLPAGGEVTIGLASTASALGSQATNTTPVTVTGPGVETAVGGRERGADIGLPIVAGADGDLGVVDRDAAMKHRVALRVSARLDAFAHLPGFGRGLDPKRTYTDAKIAQEATRIRDDLEGRLGNPDPDITRASVTAFRSAPNVVTFEIGVEPSYRPGTVNVSASITLGAS